MHAETTAHETPETFGRVCAALVAVRGGVLLAIGGEERWRRDPGCVFVPVELPGGVCPDDGSTEAAIAAIGQRWLGHPLQLSPAEITYGRSAQHAIDRLPPQPAPAPLLSLERIAPADPEHGIGVRRVVVEIFRATSTVADDDQLAPGDDCAGLVVLSWQALRQIVRGLPLADLLARNDVALRLRSGIALPPDALIYLTAEYGERTLLRVAAKYGVRALGKDVDDGTGF